MIAYHGTTVGNLRLLRPFANPHSNLSYPCVYLSTNKALASIYIWNRPYKWMTFEIREDGLPVYNESFKNGLKGIVWRCQGLYLYLSGEFFHRCKDQYLLRCSFHRTGPCCENRCRGGCLSADTAI